MYIDGFSLRKIYFSLGKRNGRGGVRDERIVIIPSETTK